MITLNYLLSVGVIQAFKLQLPALFVNARYTPATARIMVNEHNVSLLVDQSSAQFPLFLDCMAGRKYLCLESLNMFEMSVWRFYMKMWLERRWLVHSSTISKRSIAPLGNFQSTIWLPRYSNE